MLCLDGGGVLGIIEAMTLKYIHFCLQKLTQGVRTSQILQRLERFIRHNNEMDGENCSYVPNGMPNLHKMFDMIVGTSMGAIISAAIARLHMSPVDICDEVTGIAPDIFPDRKIWQVTDYLRSVIAFFYSGFHQYDSKALESYLQRMLQDTSWTGTDGDPLIGILAIKTKDSSVHLFDSRKYANSSVGLWQAIRASTAAPIYFSSMTIQDDVIGEKIELIDGGLCANSPASYAMQMLEPSKSLACLISLGCGDNEPSCNPLLRVFQYARNSEEEWEKFKFSRSSHEKSYRIAPSLSAGLGKYKLSDSKRIHEIVQTYNDWLKSKDSEWYRIEIIEASTCLFAKSILVTEAIINSVSTGYHVTFVFNVTFNEKRYERSAVVKSGYLNSEQFEFEIELNLDYPEQSLVNIQREQLDTIEEVDEADIGPVLNNSVPITLNGMYEKREGKEQINIMFQNHGIRGSPLSIRKKMIARPRKSAPGRMSKRKENDF